MSKDAFFISGVIAICTSLLLYSYAPRLIITSIDDAFVLIPHLLITQPSATFLLMLSLFCFYKTITYKK